MDLILYSAQASFARPRIDLAQFTSAKAVWILLFEFHKFWWILFASKRSFIGFINRGDRNSWKRRAGDGVKEAYISSPATRAHHTLCNRKNLSRFHEKPCERLGVEHCIVSYIDLFFYFFFKVFPTYFRFVTLPYANTAILQDWFCGTSLNLGNLCGRALFTFKPLKSQEWPDIKREKAKTQWGVTWVNFCWVCAAGLSEPLRHYSLFCGQI